MTTQIHEVEGQLNSIPKIYRLGERQNIPIFNGEVYVQEKYDGSQFSFSVKLDSATMLPELVCRSKGQVVKPEDPGMFKQALLTAQSLKNDLMPGVEYQCEYLARPKHNVLTYSRIPNRHLVLFDMRLAKDSYAVPSVVMSCAEILGLEPAALLFQGRMNPGDERQFLHRDSSLGGCLIEGIVIKNYTLSHSERPGHPMTAKLVSEQFKERHDKNFKVGEKAEKDDVAGMVAESLRTEARRLKALQRVRENGQLTNSMQDMGQIIRAMHQDIEAEEAEFIKESLYNLCIKQIKRDTCQGLAQWYAAKLSDGFSVHDSAVVAGELTINPDKLHSTP